MNGYLEARALTTTNRQAIGRRVGLRVIDSTGREYVVEAVKKIDPPGMLSDFAGTKRFQIALELRRAGRRAVPEAIAAIAGAVREKPGHFDLTEQGGEAVAAEITSKVSVAAVAELLAVKVEWRKVVAEANERENRRVEELARRGE